MRTEPAADGRLGPTAVDVTRGEAQQEMRSPVVRRDLIGVQLAYPAGRVLGPDGIFHVCRLPAMPAGIDVGRVAKELRLGPMKEILRGRGADIPSAAEVAVILAVLATMDIPEREVV